MINGFEFQKININQLPQEWKNNETLYDLEKFLQANWEQRRIFYDDNYVTTRQQFIDFDVRNGIKLQNYIGTICFNGEQLNIFPKVFKDDEDDDDASKFTLEDMLNNILIWLNYCDRTNFPFVTVKDSLSDVNSFLELMITVYVNYVKNVLSKEIFHRYEDIVDEGSYIKGKVDFLDYCNNKVPTGNLAKIKYCYSGFVLDNLLNRIIKNTCRLLYNLTSNGKNKSAIRDIFIKLGDVSDIVCFPSDCDKIHLDAYHKGYKIILGLSKIFLLNRVNAYDVGNIESFCFLFPAELLFEGFVGGYLKENFLGRAKVRTQVSDQYLADLYVNGENKGRAFLLKEDILVETNGKIIVLDTKYKEIDKFEKIADNKKLGISDADMKQMVIYAIKKNANKVYLLYPLHKNEEPETKEIKYEFCDDESKNNVSITILKIPFVFDKEINKTKLILSNILEQIISESEEKTY